MGNPNFDIRKITKRRAARASSTERNNLNKKKNQTKKENEKIHKKLSESRKQKFADLFLKTNKETDYNLIYDQLVSYGEILSSIIISKYLNSIGLKSKWVDARSCIMTDESYRDANVDFE